MDRIHRRIPGQLSPAPTATELAGLLAALDRPSLPRYEIRALPDQLSKKTQHNAPQAVVTLAELLWHVSEMHRRAEPLRPGPSTFRVSVAASARLPRSARSRFDAPATASPLARGRP